MQQAEMPSWSLAGIVHHTFELVLTNWVLFRELNVLCGQWFCWFRRNCHAVNLVFNYLLVKSLIASYRTYSLIAYYLLKQHRARLETCAINSCMTSFSMKYPPRQMRCITASHANLKLKTKKNKYFNRFLAVGLDLRSFDPQYI